MELQLVRIVLKIVGYICGTFAICERIYPTAQVPPSDLLAQSSSSIAKYLDFQNNPNLPPSVILRKYWPSSLNDLEETVLVKGYYSRTVLGTPFSIFEGIPYAKPPVGIRRFKDPEKYVNWNDTYDATKKSPVCIQLSTFKIFNVIGQEDCLYLNIYVPLQSRTRTEKYPVMIYIHGGSFSQGSVNEYGPAYLLDKDIILVVINYRLGPFGFLSTGDDRMPGNLGLKDQAMAINWVYNNIDVFGGDSNRITLFGQSAGAVATHLHMMSKYTKDKLFSAIAQSGNAFCHWAFPPVVNLTKKFAYYVGCDPLSPDLVDCLRNIPARKLSSSEFELYGWREYPLVLLGPVVEHQHKNAFISDSPEFLYRTGQVANIPLITGVNKDEGALLSLIAYLGFSTRSMLLNLKKTLPVILIYPESDVETTQKTKEFYLKDFEIPSLSGYEALDNIGKMVGDLFFYNALEKTLGLHTNFTTSPAYGYFFSYLGKHGLSEKFHVPPSQFGVVHGDDAQYLFNSTGYFFPLSPTDKDYSIVDYMTTLWTNFATNRIPSLRNSRNKRAAFPLQNGTSDTIWTRYNLREQNVLNINERLSMIKQPYKQRFDFWKSTPYY